MDENTPNQPAQPAEPQPAIPPEAVPEPAPIPAPTPVAVPTPEPAPAAAVATAPDADPTGTESNSGGFLSNLGGTVSALFFGLLNWVIIPVAIVFILHNFVFQAFHVVGSSMVPTLHESDYLIISKVDKSVAGVEHKDYIPARYQVIVFHYPKDPTLVFVKRVIAEPGERVLIKDGNVTVFNDKNPNGFSPDTNLYSRAAATTLGDIDEVVPDGQIFVLGDNRTPDGSFDSREWGTLPSSYIIGRAVIRLLPLDGFRLFSEIVHVNL